MKRKIAIFTGNRAEYGLWFPILKTISEDKRLDYKLLVSGAHLKEAFGNTLSEINKDGFKIYKEIKIDHFDDNLPGTTLGIASAIKSTCHCLSVLKPDFLVIYADRFESFGALIAGTQMGIPTAHIEGGDYTEGGALDDSVRHAMTKLAHLHFTTNKPAAERVRTLGEESWRVHHVGSPSLDSINSKDYASFDEIQDRIPINAEKPLLLFTQHSIATEWEQSTTQIKPSIKALEKAAVELNCQILMTYPNDDAGSQAMIMELENLRKRQIPNIHLVRHLGRYLYHGVLSISSACIGNSSSGIKETPAFKCPFINIGDRQKGRLRADNIIEVGYDTKEIFSAIKKSLFDEEFKVQIRDCQNPYGSGNAGKKISDILATIPLNKELLNKKMSY